MGRMGERAAARDEEKDRRPQYVVRGKTPGEDGRWVTVGAGWDFDLRDGGTGISIRLQSLPLNFDGTLSVLPWRDE